MTAVRRRFRRCAVAYVTLLVLGGARGAGAHEVRPAYLEFREQAPERVALLWKVPARGNVRLPLHAVLPASCTPVAPPRATWTGDAHVERAVLACPGGLDGARVAVDGLRGTTVDVLARVTRTDGSVHVARLTPSAPAFTIAAAPGALGVARLYAALGLEHILLGIDHLLFVLALVLLAGPTRRLIATVTAFTVAHSLTLAAATLGVVDVPVAPVEAVIALSIVLVAAEIVHAAAGRPGLTARRPWLVAFAFGLLHGLGFAGALADVGLPPQAIPLALLCFNLGVELGQLVFVAAVLGLGRLATELRLAWPAWAWRLPPYAIGSVAAYWTITRLAQL
jgi:hydrogenase/urease accessory protein HupE